MRRHGYTVRYENQAIRNISAVARHKAYILDNITAKEHILENTQAQKVIGPDFSLLPKVAKQLDTTVNVQQATNNYLGLNYSLREIMRKYLAKH